MGFFSLLFARPKYLGDVVFGRLRRDGVDRRTGKAWLVAEELVFAPTGDTINCYIEAFATGPTREQQLFFQRIEHQYPVLSARLVPVLERSFHYRNPAFRIHHFAAEFQLTDISIPVLAAEQTDPVAWEWSFRTVHDATHTFTVYMHGDTPEPNVLMDG